MEVTLEVKRLMRLNEALTETVQQLVESLDSAEDEVAELRKLRLENQHLKERAQAMLATLKHIEKRVSA